MKGFEAIRLWNSKSQVAGRWSACGGKLQAQHILTLHTENGCQHVLRFTKYHQCLDGGEKDRDDSEVVDCDGRNRVRKIDYDRIRTSTKDVRCSRD